MASRFVWLTVLLLGGATFVGPASADGEEPFPCVELPNGIICEVGGVLLACVNDATGTTCTLTVAGVGSASCSHGGSGTDCKACPHISEFENYGATGYVQKCISRSQGKIKIDR